MHIFTNKQIIYVDSITDVTTPRTPPALVSRLCLRFFPNSLFNFDFFFSQNLERNHRKGWVMLVFEYWIGRFYSFQNFCLNAGMILFDVRIFLCFQSCFETEYGRSESKGNSNLELAFIVFDVLKWIRVLMALLNNDH